MTEKASKLDKLIKVTDKLADSKLIKTLDKTLNLAGNAIGAAADVTNHQLDEHNKRHLTDVKVPDISGLSVAQAEELLATLDIKHAFVLPEPTANFAAAKVDTIVKTAPKAKTVVPAGGFVKIYYLDAETIAASQAIVAKKNRRQQIRKDAAKGLAAKLGHGTAAGAGSVLKATTSVTKKLTRTPKTPKNPKKIKATIIDVPADETSVDEPK